MEGQLKRCLIEFMVDKKPISFLVYHNLTDVKGMSINDAFENWVHRTKSYTAKSFCKYIMSKDESFVAITQTQFNRLNKYGTK